MTFRDVWRERARRTVDEGGDIGDIARDIQVHAQGKYIQAASALREEFGLSLTEVIAVVAWAEGGNEGNLDELRRSIQTPLR